MSSVLFSLALGVRLPLQYVNYLETSAEGLFGAVAKGVAVVQPSAAQGTLQPVAFADEELLAAQGRAVWVGWMRGGRLVVVTERSVLSRATSEIGEGAALSFMLEQEPVQAVKNHATTHLCAYGRKFAAVYSIAEDGGLSAHQVINTTLPSSFRSADGQQDTEPLLLGASRGLSPSTVSLCSFGANEQLLVVYDSRLMRLYRSCSTDTGFHYTVCSERTRAKGGAYVAAIFIPGEACWIGVRPTHSIEFAISHSSAADTLCPTSSSSSSSSLNEVISLSNRLRNTRLTNRESAERLANISYISPLLSDQANPVLDDVHRAVEVVTLQANASSVTSASSVLDALMNIGSQDELCVSPSLENVTLETKNHRESKCRYVFDLIRVKPTSVGNGNGEFVLDEDVLQVPDMCIGTACATHAMLHVACFVDGQGLKTSKLPLSATESVTIAFSDYRVGIAGVELAGEYVEDVTNHLQGALDEVLDDRSFPSGATHYWALAGMEFAKYQDGRSVRRCLLAVHSRTGGPFHSVSRGEKVVVLVDLKQQQQQQGQQRKQLSGRVADDTKSSAERPVTSSGGDALEAVLNLGFELQRQFAGLEAQMNAGFGQLNKRLGKLERQLALQ
jgi:hypothetical protein